MTKKIFFLLLLFTLFAPNFAFADDPPPLLEDVPSPIVRPDPIPTPKQKTPPSVRLVNPIGGKYNDDYTKQTDVDSQGKTNIQIIIGNAIQVTLRLLGAITLAVFFYGGFIWLTSAGNAEKVSTGTKTMMYATIGLFIIFGAYGILTTIISGITSGTPSTAGGTNTPTTPGAPETPEAFDCTKLADQECHSAASEGCAWVTYFIPDAGGDAYTACVNNENKASTCNQFNETCQTSGPDTNDWKIKCATQSESCKL